MQTMQTMQLEIHLAQLAASGLIRPVQTQPDSEYLFRHVLTQDAAYASLLKQDRRKLHQAVGAALEQAYADRLDDIAPVLAMHFDEAENAERAVRYLIRAGDSAAGRYANAEADMHYGRALTLAYRMNSDADQLIDLHRKLGRIRELSSDFDGALATYGELEQAANARNDQRLKLAALLAQATIFAAPTSHTDAARAEALAHEALGTAQASHDEPSEAKALWLLSLALKFSGRMTEAMEHGEACIAIARRLDLKEQLAYALNDVAAIYIQSGDMAHMQSNLDEALDLFKGLDNLPMWVDGTINSSEFHYFRGNLGQALSVLESAQRTSVRIGSIWGQAYAAWIIGMMQAEQAEYAKAIASLRNGVELGQRAGFDIAQISAMGVLAMTFANLGDGDAANQCALESIRAAQVLQPEWQGLGHVVLATVHRRRGQFAEAREVLVRARSFATMFDMSVVFVELEQCELDLTLGHYDDVVSRSTQTQIEMTRFGIHIFEPDVNYYRGRALLHLARFDEARSALQSALDAADHIGSRRIRWRILQALTHCAHAQGDAEAAGEFQQRTQEEIGIVAANLAGLPQHETFLDYVTRNQTDATTSSV